jgi:hypothetical protein
MKKVSVTVALVTLFVAFYNVSPYIGVPDRAILAMFCVAPLLTIYMVYVILKYGKPSGATFDEKYYEDWNDN